MFLNVWHIRLHTDENALSFKAPYRSSQRRVGDAVRGRTTETSNFLRSAITVKMQADPATFPMSNSILGTLFSSEDSLFIQLWQKVNSCLSYRIDFANVKIRSLRVFSKTTRCPAPLSSETATQHKVNWTPVMDAKAQIEHISINLIKSLFACTCSIKNTVRPEHIYIYICIYIYIYIYTVFEKRV